jgi:hypothetical protein
MSPTPMPILMVDDGSPIRSRRAAQRAAMALFNEVTSGGPPKMNPV